MKKQQVRSIDQTVWRDPLLPYAEFRSTKNSTLAYKKHSHCQLSIGYISQGETLTLYQNKRWTLQQE